MFDRLNERLVRALLALAALITFSLSFLVVADIIGRVGFNSPVKGTPEIVSMSIVIICFLLAGYAVYSGGMIRTDVVIGALGPRADRLSSVLTSLLGIGFFGLIVWGSFEPTLHAWTSGEFEGEGALRVPVWPARVVVLLGSALVALIYVGQLIAALRAFLRNEAAPPAPRAH